MYDKIKEFYEKNKIDIDIIETIEGLQVDTIKTILLDLNDKTLKKIKNLIPALCLYLKKDKIELKQDNKTGFLLFEIPKEKREFLDYEKINYIRSDEKGLFVNLGLDTYNNDCIIDITKTPHLLISGQTGSGKSVLLNNILSQLFYNYTPKELEAILIDIKKVELSLYKEIPHLLYKTITTYEQSIDTLKKVINNINERYEILEQSKTRNIKEYNEKYGKKMKYNIIVIDELAELFMIENKSKLAKAINGGERLEDLIVRIAQVGRACGVHLILATQRPSSDIITGLIKANVPCRIALSVASGIDSRIILDEKGAENLTGKGDAILKQTGADLVRLQSPFISDEEQEKIVNDIIVKFSNYTTNLMTEQNEEEENKKDLFFNTILYFYNNDGFTNTANNLIAFTKSEQGRQKLFDYLKQDIFDIETMAAYNDAIKDFEKLYKTIDIDEPIQPEKQKTTICGLSIPSFLLAVSLGAISGLGKDTKRKRRR